MTLLRTIIENKYFTFMLTVTALNKAYHSNNTQTVLFKELAFTLKRGESMSIMGASGCGKSTLLHIIAALISSDSGCITLAVSEPPLILSALSEHDADQYRREHLGIVFQRYNLIDYISVKDNIELPAIHKQNKDNVYIEMLVKNLGIFELLDKYPHQLSGGEQQRVAIARALAHKPRLVLADEPTGNLDPENSRKVAELLYSLCAANQISLLIVSHSYEVAALANKCFVLRDCCLNMNTREV